MAVDHAKIYDHAAAFFEPSGNAIMKLTASAACDVCLECASRQFVVLGVEGGIRDDKGFEARLDCIWDGMTTPINQANAQENNLQAAQFIKEKSNMHNAFILTVAPLGGYPRNQRRNTI